MKISTLFTFASTAALAVAAPTTPALALSKRADFCGQWDNQVQGPYTIYNNLWGRDQATSGSQCTGVDGLSGSTLKWHTKWSWAGGYERSHHYRHTHANTLPAPATSSPTPMS